MNTPIDLTALSDEELDDLIEEARQVLIRRAAVALIPAQIEGLAREYRESGGDQTVLAEAITEQEPQ